MTAAVLNGPRTLLPALDGRARAALFAVGQVRAVPRGGTLYVAGDVPHRVFFMLDGLVKLVHAAVDGRACILSLVAPGEPLNIGAATDRRPADATAVALADAQALAVPTPAWNAVVAEDPGTAALLRALLARHLRDADRDRIALVMNDTLGRVAYRLVELARRFGVQANGAAGVLRFTLPLTQQELAEWAGTSREATSRALQTLRERGLVSTSRRDVRILDLVALERRSGTAAPVG